MSLNLRWAVLAIAALLAFIQPAFAQQPQRAVPAQAGGRITAVQIQGNVRAEPETIRSYLQLKEGDAYDPAAADRSLKALFATGLFSDVVIDMQGSTLLVRVTENPILNRVVFEGNRKIDDDKLRDEVQSKPRQVFTRARVQADVERLLSIYRRGGRYNATVEPKIIRLEQGRVDLVFEIDEGDVTGIKRISFVGNEHFSDGTLRGKIRTTESAWWRFLSSDDRFDPDRLNLDRELLRKFYLSEGYADFRVVAVGVVATFFAFEPARADEVLHAKPPLWSARGLKDAVIGPFVDFFRKHKYTGLLILLAVALYRLPDFIMGPMYNPFYHDLGISKDTVALVRGSFGLVATFVGLAAAGLSAIRIGLLPTLVVGLALEACGTASFALLSVHTNDVLFAAVMSLDSFAQAFAGVALVTYMSSLTSLGYTATQYAMLSSTYAVLGKFLKGFSGVAVDALTPTYGLLGAYATAFVVTGLTAIPPLLLFVLLWRMQKRAG